MRRRRETRRHRLPELNLTPLIDVVFNLLIFVLVTASFSKPDSVPTELPRSSRASPGGDAIVVMVGPTMAVDAEPVTWLTLESATRGAIATRGTTTALLIADRTLPTGTLVEAQDALARAGITTMRLATEAVR